MLIQERDDVRGGASREAASREAFKVLGVRVDAVQIPDVVDRMRQWIDRRERGRYVAVTGMHGISETRRDPAFRQVIVDADLVVPDGMPLVWLARLKGQPLPRRVYGPELLQAFCEATAHQGYRHFFYGGPEGVAQRLGEALAGRFRGVQVAGVLSPPFRGLTPEETADVQRRINAAAPDVVWVGLSTPKQELWMAENRAHLRVPVLVGVGAAFDLLTGRVRQAPAWMREHGLEWCWRLSQEPGRLWRRYLFGGSRFVRDVTLELSGLKRFD